MDEPQPSTPFNPLDKPNLGRSIMDALLSTAYRPMSDIVKLKGAGVYAIYYSGGFVPYGQLAAVNREAAAYPIYVGKAIPKGGRKGGSLDASLDSNALVSRLQEHAETLRSVESLKIEDFVYRMLPVDDIWISLGETLLIQRFQPLWNQVVEGFGNHDPGSGRYNGRRPIWDELHPGRAWAAKCQSPNKTHSQIIAEVEAYMKRTFS